MYQFNYQGKQKTFVGIMAQDILDQHPEAVRIDENGFYRVNYTMLGLKMATLSDWQKYGLKSVELLPNP
ncbi:hypothetical protein N9060_00460 [Arenicella sp.]|nr:hypothetical protein [Arenicella sp.]